MNPEGPDAKAKDEEDMDFAAEEVESDDSDEYETSADTFKGRSGSIIGNMNR